MDIEVTEVSAMGNGMYSLIARVKGAGDGASVTVWRAEIRDQRFVRLIGSGPDEIPRWADRDVWLDSPKLASEIFDAVVNSDYCADVLEDWMRVLKDACTKAILNIRRRVDELEASLLTAEDRWRDATDQIQAALADARKIE